MSYIIGSASVAAYTSTDTYDSGASINTAMFNGNDTQGIAASSTATAATLNLYISSWGALSNIKACLYAANTLVDTLVINSSVGTGEVAIPWTPATAITSATAYRLALYTDSNTPITLHTSTAGLTRRLSTAGTYASPVDPLPAGNFVSTNEFY